MLKVTVAVLWLIYSSPASDAFLTKRAAPSSTPSTACLQCMLAVGVLDALTANAPDALVETIIGQACPMVGLQDPSDCNELVQQFKVGLHPTNSLVVLAWNNYKMQSANYFISDYGLCVK